MPLFLISSRNFLTVALPFLPEDTAPAATFAALCATSSANMNGSFVPEFAMKNDLNSDTDPIFSLISNFSHTLQFTTRLNLSGPNELAPGALLQSQIQTKRYFIHQLTSLECFPNSDADHRIFIENCLPHLRALRKLSFKMVDLEYKDGSRRNEKTHIAALVPLVNLEDLSIDGSESSDLWLSDIWKQNPMPHLRKLKIIGGWKLRSISQFHANHLEVLDLTMNFRVYSEQYYKVFGIPWSVPDLRKMNSLRELCLRGGSVLEEAVVDGLLGYKNRKPHRVAEKEDFSEGSEMYERYQKELFDNEDFVEYGEQHNIRFVRKCAKRHCYGEAHGLWLGTNVRNIKTSLESIDEEEEEEEEEDNDDDTNSDKSDNDSAVSSTVSSVPSSVVSLSEKVGICKKLRKLHLSGGFFLNSHAGEVYRIIDEIGSSWITEIDLNGLRFNFRKYQEKYPRRLLELSTPWDDQFEDEDAFHDSNEGTINLDDKVMAFAITKFRHVTVLQLSNCNSLGDETLLAIGKYCSSLTKLQLPDFGHVTDKGIAALFDPKKSNNTFRTLEELVVGTERQQNCMYDPWYDPYRDYGGYDNGVDNPTVDYKGEVFGNNWFGKSNVLTAKMSYRLKKLDCSDLFKLNPDGIVQIMNAFSHCLEEFNLPEFDRDKGLVRFDDDNIISVNYFMNIVKFPVMQKLETVTNLPLHVLGFPNIGNFIRACPILGKLRVIYEYEDKDDDDPDCSDAEIQWFRFEKQEPSLKEMRRIPDSPWGDHWYKNNYDGPTLDQLLAEVAKALQDIDEKNDAEFKGIEFGFFASSRKIKIHSETWDLFANIESLNHIIISKEHLSSLWSLAEKRDDVCLWNWKWQCPQFTKLTVNKQLLLRKK